MKICLRYLADLGYQSGVGEDIGVSQSTVSKTFTKVIKQIYAKSGQWIKFPITDAEIADAKRLWQTRFNFPCAIGVLDCTHVRICKPTNYGDEYINRKGYASINV